MKRRWNAALAPSDQGSIADVELEVGSDSHYEDARYYSDTYEERTEDVAYYLELASEHGGPVLEYGCGNGRICLPIARAGVRITGVDRSATMLRDLRRAVRQEPREVQQRITVRKGDMRRLRAGKRFGLVLCTFNTFLHLYTRDDVEKFCVRVRDHMTARGRFIVDTCIPDPEELHRDPQRLYRMPRFRHPNGQMVKYGERFDYDPLRQVLFINMEFEPSRKPSQRWNTPLAHRQFFPQELEALLYYNGLEVIDVHGDFKRESPSLDAVELAYHCKKRRGF